MSILPLPMTVSFWQFCFDTVGWTFTSQTGNSFVKYECHPAFASGNSSWNERVMEFYVFDLKVTENRWMRPQTKGERVYWQNEIY